MSVQQNDAHFKHIFTRFDINFSRMLENLITGSLGEVN